MTDVEFSRLLSDLADTAKTLNRESDSINDTITRFQKGLRELNLGMEAWIFPHALDAEAWMDEDRSGEEYERGRMATELGFAKYFDNEWHLLTRRAYYDHGTHGFANVWEFVRAEDMKPLLQASRETRIEALKYFPELTAELKKVAAEALKAIKDAKKFVQ